MKSCVQCQMRYPNDAKFCFVDGAELAAIPDPRVGTTIAGRYVLDELIGEGGMASVYRARHKLVDRPCAIKIMSPQLARDAVVRERFRREAKSAQKLAHPNIIEIFDQGDTEDGTAYIAMELLTGSALADLVQHGPLPVTRAVGIMIQLARGIARAHDLEVVHRDLKPENVFVCRREEGSDLVKILDFGIARSRSDSRLTNAGELFGTPQYMAPERITNPEAGASVDLYALGVIYYEMVTGQLPFVASDATQFLVKHIKEPPRPPREVAPELPFALERLILELLAKQPKDRPVDAHRVQADLVALAGSLGVAVPLEPEADPTSSQLPSRTLPSISIDAWGGRVRIFEQMLHATYGAGAAPPELAAELADLTELLARAQEVRRLTIAEQRQLEDIQLAGREGRLRFGFAVDALGVDASRAKDELRTAQGREEAIARDVEGRRAAFLEAHRNVTAWEGRAAFQQPYVELALAYRAAADEVDAWMRARGAHRAAATAAEERERTVSDLEFQIRELRTALANHERNIDAEYEKTEGKLLELNATGDELERKLLASATRFCAPLRGRPELAQLFQRLEADAAAAPAP